MNIILRFFALIGIISLIPLILFASFLVFFEDGLPIFFIQKRLGKEEKIFKLLKIRTMYNKTPNLGTHEIKVENYLKIGIFLRKTKIDELPQVLNFIIGNIDLVGPRPGLPNQDELLHFRRKYKVFRSKPGITGLGQILGYDMSNPEILAKIDNLYISNKSIKLDIKILIATFIKQYRSEIRGEFSNSIKILEDANNV